ncbi:MAG: hypothetical protein ACM3WU_04335 [Bacillota bacterium]
MAQKPQFVYFLKLVPRLLDVDSWTAADEEVVDWHFTRLQELTAEGKVN